MTGKAKKFWDDHKVKILVVGGTVLTVALCGLGVKKKLTLRKLADTIPDLANNVDIPADFGVGEITELWKEGDYLNAIVNNVTTKDLGRLGEEFVKRGIVPDGTKVSLVIGFI